MKFGTYARVPSGVIAITKGVPPTEIGKPLTVLLAIFITETVISTAFVTYARVPSGVIAIHTGLFPTEIGEPLAVLLAVFITENVLSN